MSCNTCTKDLFVDSHSYLTYLEIFEYQFQAMTPKKKIECFTLTDTPNTDAEAITFK